MLTDPNALKQRARRLYEIGRLRSALSWSIPALIVAGVTSAIMRQMSMPLALGLVLYAASVGMLWWGRTPGRGTRSCTRGLRIMVCSPTPPMSMRCSTA